VEGGVQFFQFVEIAVVVRIIVSREGGSRSDDHADGGQSACNGEFHGILLIER
jgi:hypothetical protein